MTGLIIVLLCTIRLKPYNSFQEGVIPFNVMSVMAIIDKERIREQARVTKPDLAYRRAKSSWVCHA